MVEPLWRPMFKDTCGQHVTDETVGGQVLLTWLRLPTSTVRTKGHPTAGHHRGFFILPTEPGCGYERCPVLAITDVKAGDKFLGGG